MRSALLQTSLCACLLLGCQSTEKKAISSSSETLPIPTGIYVGLDEMKGFPAEQPGDKWYHENYVYIRPDSLFLESSPVVIHQNGERGYSASDGGFYSYSGRIDTTGGKFIAKLLMFAHDYIVETIIFKDKAAAKSNLSTDELIKRGLAERDSSFYKKTYVIMPTAAGFEMDGVRYVATTPDSLLAPVGFPDAKRFFNQARNARP